MSDPVIGSVVFAPRSLGDEHLDVLRRANAEIEQRVLTPKRLARESVLEAEILKAIAEIDGGHIAMARNILSCAIEVPAEIVP